MEPMTLEQLRRACVKDAVKIAALLLVWFATPWAFVQVVSARFANPSEAPVVVLAQLAGRFWMGAFGIVAVIVVCMRMSEGPLLSLALRPLFKREAAFLRQLAGQPLAPFLAAVEAQGRGLRRHDLVAVARYREMVRELAMFRQEHTLPALMLDQFPGLRPVYATAWAAGLGALAAAWLAMAWVALQGAAQMLQGLASLLGFLLVYGAV